MTYVDLTSYQIFKLRKMIEYVEYEGKERRRRHKQFEKPASAYPAEVMKPRIAHENFGKKKSISRYREGRFCKLFCLPPPRED